MGEKGDPLAQSSLEQGQNIREDSADVIAIVVHQLTQEIQFLTAGLELHQLTQPGCSPKDANHRSEKLPTSQLRQISPRTVLEHMVTGPYHGFGGHQEAMETVHCGVVPKLH